MFPFMSMPRGQSRLFSRRRPRDPLWRRVRRVFTLTSYSRRATAGSRAWVDGASPGRSAKYCPVRFATVGDAARKIGVSAPFAGLLEEHRTKRKNIGLPSERGLFLMTPGWAAFTVTPVPASRPSVLPRGTRSARASTGRKPCTLVRAFGPAGRRNRSSHPCGALDETFTIRDGVEASNRSRSRWLSRNPPR